jgi:hypothetical protein
MKERMRLWISVGNIPSSSMGREGLARRVLIIRSEVEL